MKHFAKTSTILAVLAVLAIGCNKDDERTSLIPENKGENPEGLRLGRKLDNPYTVENMSKALDSLQQIGQLDEHINIHPTHLYVQLFPKDSADMNKILEDTNLHLFPYPLDYELEGEGSFEVAEGETPKVYTVVPVGYNIPINYTVIDECFIPTEYNHELETLEIASLVRTGNITEEELKELHAAKGLLKYPKGYVRVYNTDDQQYEGVRGVKVYTQKIVKIGRAYTNNEGYYNIGTGYLCNPTYAVAFENNNGFKIWGNIGPLSPAIHNVGSHNRSGYNINIGTNSQAWPWATINNAALLYRTFLAPHFGVTNTPNNLRFWYINISSGNWNGSAPMLRRLSGYTSSQVEKWLRLIGFNAVSSWIFRQAVYVAMQCCPDILIMNNAATSTKKLRKTIFHEMSHASHYRKAGPAYWLTYIGQICLHFGYGNSYTNTTGVIGVGEMWGEYFGKTCFNYYYDPDENCSDEHWFKPQILMNIDRDLDDIYPSRIFQVLDASVTNPDELKAALIYRWGHSDCISQRFSEYGF